MTPFIRISPPTRWLAWLSLALFTAAPAAAADSAFPVKVSANGRYLVDRNGAPFLVHGDTAWSLISGLTKEEADRYLEDRRAKGFNALIVNLIEHKFKGPANRAGELPFAAPADFSRPNEKYFEHADWVLARAAGKGMLVFLAPMYLGYKGLDEGWYEEAVANGPEKCGQYGRFLGARYKSFHNIVWMMGGDRKPEAAWQATDTLARAIREQAPDHLFTAHAEPESSAVDEYAAGSWLDLNTTYTYNIVHRMLLRDYKRKPPMPFVLIESTYEGEHNASPLQIRRQAYWALLCGATGQFLGNRPMWLYDPGWERALDSAGSRDMVHLHSLFASLPWYQLIPDAGHTVVVSGLGEFNGLDYLAAARAAEGALVVAYIPGQHTFSVDMSQVSGTSATASWFNPVTGRTTAAGLFPTSGKHDFRPPAQGDWVLVLRGNGPRTGDVKR